MGEQNKNKSDGTKISGFNSKNFLINLASGGTAAAFSKTAIAPIERVKLLLQVYFIFYLSKHFLFNYLVF